MAGSVGIHKIHVANSYRNVCPPADHVTPPTLPPISIRFIHLPRRDSVLRTHDVASYPAKREASTIPSKVHYQSYFVRPLPGRGETRVFVNIKASSLPSHTPTRLPPAEGRGQFAEEGGAGGKVREIRLLSLPRKRRA